MESCVQMATLSKAEALLEDLRSASWDAAVKDLDDVKAFAAKQVCMHSRLHTKMSGKSRGHYGWALGSQNKTVQEQTKFHTFALMLLRETNHYWYVLHMQLMSKRLACLQGFKEELKQWDVSFWAERLREAKFNITDEELRPYFALPNVLKGLFQVGHLLPPHHLPSHHLPPHHLHPHRVASPSCCIPIMLHPCHAASPSCYTQFTLHDVCWPSCLAVSLHLHLSSN